MVFAKHHRNLECVCVFCGCRQTVGCTFESDGAHCHSVVTGMLSGGLGQARPWVGPQEGPLPSSRAPPSLGSGPVAEGPHGSF